MNWFSGNIAEAVALSKAKNSIFVVYCEGISFHKIYNVEHVMFSLHLLQTKYTTHTQKKTFCYG